MRQTENSPYKHWLELLESRAEETPDNTAFGFIGNVLDDEVLMTYAELDRKSRSIAANLQQMAKAGDRVVLLFQPGADYICALMSCFYAGMIAVPVYAPRMNASYERVLQVTQSANASVLMSTRQVVLQLQDAAWQALMQSGLKTLASDDEHLLPESEWKRPELRPDSLAVLQYTSGSTGVPKGVMLTHDHLITNSRMIARNMACNRESVGVIWLPPYHDMGLIGGILQPMYTGFPVHLMSPATFLQRPMRWLEAITKFGATHSAGPNFGYEHCVKRARPEIVETLDLSTWQVAGNGAEPVRAETLRAFSETFAPAGFRSTAFMPCYGMAETTLFVTGMAFQEGVHSIAVSRTALSQGYISQPVSPEDSTDLVSSGRADPEVRVAVVHPESLQVLPDGQVGEIWISGATVAAGYWERPEDTRDAFHNHLAGDATPWLRSGDLGVMLEQHLYVTGRIKDLIILRGQNHYPHDLEKTVNGLHPAIRAQGVAAFSADLADAEQLVMVVEIDRKYREGQDFLKAIIRDAISKHHQLQIDQLVLVAAGEISKTSSGKIQRLQTRKRWQAGELVLLEENLSQMQTGERNDA